MDETVLARLSDNKQNAREMIKLASAHIITDFVLTIQNDKYINITDI
ncbi:hypothetical protein TUM4438_46060 [Shewanella sairae]|uniref:Uncharacterized protein n=1 Tax=Shewanella sairae TaxID=190310 RepID=A0ABQ4PRY3_9GAMM|nr:hypothetical protein TUM4438_46060 [Shewanella sairae]